MANISIPNLNPSGSDLFSDTESYMNDFTDSDLDQVNGGIYTSPIYSPWTLDLLQINFRSSCQRQFIVIQSSN
jgi:hypothetical protein